jgi:hypothetical protein
MVESFLRLRLGRVCGFSLGRLGSAGFACALRLEPLLEFGDRSVREACLAHTHRDGSLAPKQVVDDRALVLPAQGELAVHHVRRPRARLRLPRRPVDVLGARVAGAALAVGHVAEIPRHHLGVQACPVHGAKTSDALSPVGRRSPAPLRDLGRYTPVLTLGQTHAPPSSPARRASPGASPSAGSGSRSRCRGPWSRSWTRRVEPELVHLLFARARLERRLLTRGASTGATTTSIVDPLFTIPGPRQPDANTGGWLQGIAGLSNRLWLPRFAGVCVRSAPQILNTDRHSSSR